MTPKSTFRTVTVYDAKVLAEAHNVGEAGHIRHDKSFDLVHYH